MVVQAQHKAKVTELVAPATIGSEVCKLVITKVKYALEK
jgi:hypothetical protein